MIPIRLKNLEFRSLLFARNLEIYFILIANLENPHLATQLMVIILFDWDYLIFYLDDVDFESQTDSSLLNIRPYYLNPLYFLSMNRTTKCNWLLPKVWQHCYGILL